MKIYTCFSHAFCVGWQPILKYLVVMKIVVLMICIVCLKVSAAVYAQEITIAAENRSIRDVFNQIERQSDYVFYYSNQALKEAGNVTVNLQGVTIEEALKAIFKGQPLTFEVADKTILVKQKPARPTTVTLLQDTIRGTVTDNLGNPLGGVAVRILGTNRGTITNTQGRFQFNEAPENANLQFRLLGFNDTTLTASSIIQLALRSQVGELAIADVNVSTGLQTLPKERATGSFVVIDSTLFNRRVGTNVLDRLDGVTSGLYFNENRVTRELVSSPYGNLGINIRGESTLSAQVSRDPLIVLDNFPYEGTLNNLNPNDIESVTLLKDAAAASIWGARSGNGVIVITTKKGRANQAPQISFNSNINIGNKPDLFGDHKFLNSSEFIDIEKHLYENGFFNADISNTTDRPPLSPVLEILASSLSETEKNAQIDALRTLDYRHDMDRYFYQKSIDQQYSLGIRGGGNDLVYSFSVGYDSNRDNQVNNGYNRLTFNSQSTYTPIKNLDLTVALNYTRSNTSRGNQIGYGDITVGGAYSNFYPYAQLADDQGNALAVVKDYRTAYVESTSALGFLDWQYRPLDEIHMANAYDKTNNLLARFSAKYKFSSFLNAEILYQNELQTIDTWQYHSTQTYYARNLINRFSQYNAATQSFTYPLPNGGILNQGDYERLANNGRVQLNYDQNFREKHQLTAIAGAEIREFNTRNSPQNTYYGYDNEYGTLNNRLNYNTIYPLNPIGATFIAPPANSINGTVNRFLSYYANAAYTYNNRYTATLSGRRDGANIFGARTNDKITPLWSAGLGWEASKESFYQADWLPYLRLRASYGFNGNVYNGSAYAIGTYSTSVDLTRAQTITNISAPNPELRWEKVKNINLGIDFATKNNRISGTIEPWLKDGADLINSIPLATSTGFTSFNGNSAHTRTKGIDIQLNTQNLNGPFKWNSAFLVNLLQDKVKEYNITQTNTSIRFLGGVALVDHPLYSIFSYQWAGLDPANGDPQGYLNGVVSKNYTGIINNFEPDSLVFHGSARPTNFGALRNDFVFHDFSLSVNITYKFGHYFRRPSTSTNYSEVISLFGYSDGAERWQNPGDENITLVPSFVYPSNANRNDFYQYSEVLVEKADHIRLQDIRLGYNLTRRIWSGIPFKSCQIYAYANNLGILWRANNHDIDPDVVNSNVTYNLPNPFSIAFGLNINL